MRNIFFILFLLFSNFSNAFPLHIKFSQWRNFIPNLNTEYYGVFGFASLRLDNCSNSSTRGVGFDVCFLSYFPIPELASTLNSDDYCSSAKTFVFKTNAIFSKCFLEVDVARADVSVIEERLDLLSSYVQNLNSSSSKVLKSTEFKSSADKTNSLINSNSDDLFNLSLSTKSLKETVNNQSLLFDEVKAISDSIDKNVSSVLTFNQDISGNLSQVKNSNSLIIDFTLDNSNDLSLVKDDVSSVLSISQGFDNDFNSISDKLGFISSDVVNGLDKSISIISEVEGLSNKLEDVSTKTNSLINSNSDDLFNLSLSTKSLKETVNNQSLLFDEVKAISDSIDKNVSSVLTFNQDISGNLSQVKNLNSDIIDITSDNSDKLEVVSTKVEVVSNEVNDIIDITSDNSDKLEGLSNKLEDVSTKTNSLINLNSDNLFNLSLSTKSLKETVNNQSLLFDEVKAISDSIDKNVSSVLTFNQDISGNLSQVKNLNSDIIDITSDNSNDLSLVKDDVSDILVLNKGFGNDFNSIFNELDYLSDDFFNFSTNFDSISNELNDVSGKVDFVSNQVIGVFSKIDDVSTQVEDLSAQSSTLLSNSETSQLLIAETSGKLSRIEELLLGTDDDSEIEKSIKDKFSDFASSVIKSTTFNVTQTVCPSFTFKKDTLIVGGLLFNSHCIILEDIRQFVSSMMLVFFSIIGFRVVFSA